MAKNLVHDYTRVVPEVYMFYADRWDLEKEKGSLLIYRIRLKKDEADLSDDDTTKCICNGRIYTHKVEFNRTLREPLYLNLQVLPFHTSNLINIQVPQVRRLGDAPL